MSEYLKQIGSIGNQESAVTNVDIVDKGRTYILAGPPESKEVNALERKRIIGETLKLVSSGKWDLRFFSNSQRRFDEN